MFFSRKHSGTALQEKLDSENPMALALREEVMEQVPVEAGESVLMPAAKPRWLSGFEIEMLGAWSGD